MQWGGLLAPDPKCREVRTTEKQGRKEWVRGRRLRRTEMEATGEAVRDRRTPRLACPQEWLPAAYSEGGTKLRDPREGEMLSRSLVNKRLFSSTGSPACRL